MTEPYRIPQPKNLAVFIEPSCHPDRILETHAGYLNS
jgi:hypothetical protein